MVAMSLGGGKSFGFRIRRASWIRVVSMLSSVNWGEIFLDKVVVNAKMLQRQ